MKRSILLFPDFNNINIIESIRKKYDPLFKHIKPHITLVFPFDSDIPNEELKKHIENSLKEIEPFKIKLKGITGTLDNYLFLNIKVGNDKIIEIHDRLYTGILEKFHYKRITYIPHITVGNILDDKQFGKALNDVKDLNDEFETLIDEIFVEEIDETDDSKILFSVKI